MPTATGNTDTVISSTRFEIYSDGELVPPGVGIISVLIQNSINRIPSARLVLIDGDVTTGDFSASASELFVPGKPIEIKAGYDGNQASVFKGIIVRHGIEFTEGNLTHLIIELRDPCVKLTVGRKNKYFFDSKDSEIIEEIIGGYSGLSSDVESTDNSHPSMVQYYVTDWDFILRK